MTKSGQRARLSDGPPKSKGPKVTGKQKPKWFGEVLKETLTITVIDKWHVDGSITRNTRIWISVLIDLYDLYLGSMSPNWMSLSRAAYHPVQELPHGYLRPLGAVAGAAHIF